MSVKNSSKSKILIPGTAGGVIFLLAYILFNLPFLISVLMSIGGYFAFSLLFSPVSFKGIQVSSGAGMTEAEVLEVLQKGRDDVENIRNISGKIKNTGLTLRISGICLNCDKIIGNLAKNPSKIRQARKFLDYYLNTLTKILTRYLELEQQNLTSMEAISAMRKVEDLAETIGKAFEQQLNSMFQSDILDLDAEIEILESSARSDGLVGDYKISDLKSGLNRAGEDFKQ